LRQRSWQQRARNGRGEARPTVAALKQGAIDFFEKLFDVDALLASSRAALMGGTKATTSSFQLFGAALQ
jgi:FixJ family two-component response regulator